MKIKALLPIFAVGLVGCTSVKVTPLAKTEAINRICIQKNNAVAVQDFLPVVQRRLEYNHIESVVFTDTRPENCPYIMNYTARRTWDVVPYLSFAELSVNHNGVLIASAHFHLRGRGGLSLMKWRGTEYKINPLIDKLVGSRE